MSDDPSGQRPRPQYGEYATPEEQRARIQHPDATWALDTGQAPDQAAPPVTPAWGASSSPAEVETPVAPAPRPADRIVTFALLAYGALNIIFTASSFFDLPALATQAMSVLGIEGEFTNIASAQLWGPIAAVVLVVGFVVTAVLSLRRLRTGRLTWWMPLVGAFLTYIVVYICISVPLLSDPAFQQYVSS